MPRVNANWFLTGFTWLLAIGLTFWNLATIEAVSKARDQSERLRNELLFHRQYAGKLESIRQTAETYTLPVESAKLGFLGAQNRLETLGAIFGLAPFMVARQAGAAMPEQWPLTVSCEGSLENTVRFLNALEDLICPCGESSSKSMRSIFEPPPKSSSCCSSAWKMRRIRPRPLFGQHDMWPPVRIIHHETVGQSAKIMVRRLADGCRRVTGTERVSSHGIGKSTDGRAFSHH